MTDRVLQIIASLRPGGPASQLATLTRALGGRGVKVRVVALRDGPLRGPLVAAGAEVLVLPRRHALDPLVVARLRRAVREQRSAVVHAWDPIAALHARAARVGPLVVGVDHPEAFPGRGIGKRAAAWVDRAVRGYAAASRPIAEQLSRRVDAAKVAVVPRAVEGPPPADALTRDEAFTELDLPPHARPIAVVSRLVPRENVRELVWAADLVRVLEDDVRLVIFGDGAARPALKRFARMASDLEHVRFAGERGDVRRLLPHFDLMWHAGDDHAPPVAVLEAMAAGLPVVADDTPGSRIAVDEGETGFLVPPSGRAERGRLTKLLLDDQDFRQRLGSASRSRVAERFGVDRLVDSALARYDSVQPEAASPSATA